MGDVGGGTDVWNSSGPDAASADHLVVMVHGILGSTADWKFAADQFVKMLPDKVIVHCSQRNMYKLTLDGVDVMGERLAEEVTEAINKRPNLRKISFIAHSVGGLVARYAIGRLYKSPKWKSLDNPLCTVCDDNQTGSICGLLAMNFITVATPHLGSRGNKQIGQGQEIIPTRLIEVKCGLARGLQYRLVGFSTSGKYWSDNLLIHRLECHIQYKVPAYRRSVDQYGPVYLLLTVSSITHSRSALQAFKRRVAYSNVDYDHIVGWRTSSIRRNSDLPEWEDSLNERYPHIVYEEYSAGSRNDKCLTDSLTNGDCDMIEEMLVMGLTRLSWERVDVSIQRFGAHSVIQVKDGFEHSEGADVIQHMIDHFLT
ncbi:serine esterase family protein [Musa troglodytarum]|uniref:Serine esterase family protein n=1 Tax=Musa troglodytarum TaxID=320322 RepID=A0A9E7JQ30_9LILI|nr:serine esterase family protein [Musa troglodytarum]